MPDASILWDCPTCGKALISGDSCPKCGTLRSGGWFAVAQSGTNAQPNASVHHSKHVFLLNSQHTDYVESKSQFLTRWDRPDFAKLMACGYGLGGVVFGLCLLWFLDALFRRQNTIVQQFLRSGSNLVIAGVLVVAIFITIAAGWYAITEPKRQMRRDSAAKRQLIEGTITSCDGTWKRSGWSKSSSWNYEVNLYYSFNHNNVVHTMAEQTNRNDLGSSRPWFTFSNNLGTETSSANPNLPSPGTMVVILQMEDSTYMLL